jgi:diacylglycerol kinase family enzyme
MRQVTGVIKNVDVGNCNGHVFLLWAGIGLDAHIVDGIEPRGRAARLFGRWYYMIRGVWLGRRFRGGPVRLCGENKGIDNIILGAVATNVPQYAGGLATLDREAEAEGGRLALWVFHGDGFGDALVQFGALLAGRHQEHRSVERIVAPTFVLESDTPVPLQLDGEPAGRASYYEINVLPSALRVFVPVSVGKYGWERFWR